jgi:hypothetical protein
VWVRLTDLGRTRLREIHELLGQAFDLREDKAGWSQWRMRDLMVSLGSEAPLLMHPEIRLVAPETDDRGT